MNKQPEIIKELLDNSPITFLDVGSSGGITDLPGLAKYTNVIGFEPNKDEFEKLQNEITTRHYLHKRGVRKLPKFKNKKFLPYALFKSNGSEILYVTKSQGTTSILKPNFEFLNTLKLTSWIEGYKIISEQQVQTISLDQVIKKYELEHIDFLKLDTQGSEYDILNVSQLNKKMISIIKTEAEVVSLYERQGLLHDISKLLYDNGFSLIDLQLKPLRHLNQHFPYSKYRLGWTDAIFIQDNIEIQKNEFHFVKQALILAELGFVDLCGHLLKRVSIITEKDKNQLLTYYGDYPNVKLRQKIFMKGLKAIKNNFWIKKIVSPLR